MWSSLSKLTTLAPAYALRPIQGGPALSATQPQEYGTTRTNVESAVKTTFSVPLPYGPNPTYISIISYETRTTYEVGPATSFPATLVDTIIWHMTQENIMTYYDGEVSTSYSSGEYTELKTRLVSGPEPTGDAG